MPNRLTRGLGPERSLKTFPKPKTSDCSSDIPHYRFKNKNKETMWLIWHLESGSCPTQVSKNKCQSLFSCLSSLSCLTCLWYFSPEEVAKCLLKWPPWKVSSVLFVKKLEVVHKRVGGCLISYNLLVACVRKLEENWPDRSTLQYVGDWQRQTMLRLKSDKNIPHKLIYCFIWKVIIWNKNHHSCFLLSKLCLIFCGSCTNYLNFPHLEVSV